MRESFIMISNESKNISVITATFNAANTINNLVESLRKQTDQNFKWIVVDGMSTDNTLEIVRKQNHQFNKLIIINENDFGIYHALNLGIKNCNTEYYIIAGSDDIFYPDSIANFKKESSQTNADIIAAKIRINNRVKRSKSSSFFWLYGGEGLVASHSIATAIKTSSHDRIGMYSNVYPVYADGEFLIKAHLHGLYFSYPEFCAGEFCTKGISNQNQLISFTDQFKAFVLNGQNFYIQWLLFNLRVMKWARKIIRNQNKR